MKIFVSKYPNIFKFTNIRYTLLVLGPIEKKFKPVIQEGNKYLDHFMMHVQHRAQNLNKQVVATIVVIK